MACQKSGRYEIKAVVYFRNYIRHSLFQKLHIRHIRQISQVITVIKLINKNKNIFLYININNIYFIY